ncbi:hypothetical protein KUCAC02_022016, partial [Chaenocephalus aceratus]
FRHRLKAKGSRKSVIIMSLKSDIWNSGATHLLRSFAPCDNPPLSPNNLPITHRGVRVAALQQRSSSEDGDTKGGQVVLCGLTGSGVPHLNKDVLQCRLISSGAEVSVLQKQKLQVQRLPSSHVADLVIHLQL